jgi:tetratricopeptide (TPR) repeat protein
MIRRLRNGSILLFFFLSVVAGDGGPQRYELRGRVLQPDGKALNLVRARAVLHGTTFPYNAEKDVDLTGRFKFSKLAAGTYWLTLIVPGEGSMDRTVVVTRSLADRKGIISEDFFFEANKSEPGQTVSAKELSVSAEARKEMDRAFSSLEKADVEGARSHLEAALRLAPQFSAAWNQLGVLCYQTRDYESAERYFREALKQEPHSYAPLVNLGGALLSLGKAEESLDINQRAAKRVPTDPLARSQLGLSFFMLSRFEAAEEELRKAKEIDPRHFSQPQLVLAEIYRVQEKYPQFLAELREFLRYHPDSEHAAKIRQLLKEADKTGEQQ